MAYEDYHVNADDVKLDGDPNIRRTVPPSPSSGGGIAYGTCTTAAATAAKVVTLSDASGWELKQGAIVAVKFSNTNTFSATAQDPVTLNVNNTGAKNIYYGGSANPTGTNTTAFGRANYVNTYVYDGTYWVWAGSSSDNNTTYSAMSTSELTTGTATTSRVVRADYLKAAIEEIAESSAIDTANNTVAFTSSDVADGSATSWTSVSKLNSGESHSNIFAKVSQMFKNIRYLYSSLVNAWNVIRNTSSDEYSTSKSYKVGDYCIYNNTLYRCTTACSAGSWSANSSCFTADTLTNAVSTLKDALTGKSNLIVGTATYKKISLPPQTSTAFSITANKSGYTPIFGIVICREQGDYASINQNITKSNGSCVASGYIRSVYNITADFGIELNVVWVKN